MADVTFKKGGEIIITLKAKPGIDDDFIKPRRGVIEPVRALDYLPRRLYRSDNGNPGGGGDVVSLPPQILFQYFSSIENALYNPVDAFFNILPNAALGDNTVQKREIEYSHFADFVQPEDIIRRYMKDCADCEYYEVDEFPEGVPSNRKYTVTFDYPRGQFAEYDNNLGYNLSQPLEFIVNRFNPSDWYYDWLQNDSPSPGELFVPNTTVYIRGRDFYVDSEDWSEWSVTSVTFSGV